MGIRFISMENKKFLNRLAQFYEWHIEISKVRCSSMSRAQRLAVQSTCLSAAWTSTTVSKTRFTPNDVNNYFYKEQDVYNSRFYSIRFNFIEICVSEGICSCKLCFSTRD